MSRPPRAPWLASRVGCAILLTSVFILVALAPRPAAAQQAGAPAPPVNTQGEQAAGAQPARPEPGAGVQPTPPPTTEIKPTPPPPVEARPPEAVPPAAPQPPVLQKDEQKDAGYLPGYKPYPSFNLGPHVPRTGALPGGVTPGYGAPMPPGEWVFTWSGYLSASAQFSTNTRLAPQPGQSSTVFHVTPETIDEYQSFVGTSTVPGQWVAMNFKYGNRDVTTVLTLSTWNPTESTTFYQLGSQGFVNNAYVDYNLPAWGKFNLKATIGYFFNNYGNLGQYGPGIYQSPIVGGPRGLGLDLLGQYQLDPQTVLLVEGGFMGNRNGKAPAGTTPANPNSGADPSFPGAYVAHLHGGIIRRGPLVLKMNLHWLYNFAQDDRPQQNCFVIDGVFACRANSDNMTTRGIDEAYIPDAHIAVYGIDATASHPVWGQLSAGGSHVSAANAFLLRGLLTYGGEGQPLTERWLGVETGGTGQMDVAGINYSGSVGRMLAAPAPFDPNGPDLIINAGAIVAHSNTADPLSRYDGRLRYKYGIDAYYAFLPYMGAGARFDQVVPNTAVPAETFEVLAARLVFKTDWASRETITLLYAKWFYGTESHREYSSGTFDFQRLDDQLFALNVNMWW